MAGEPAGETFGVDADFQLKRNGDLERFVRHSITVAAAM